MPTILGADGCPHGWCAIRLEFETRALTPLHFPTFSELLDAHPDSIVAIDVPIGLIDEGPGGRECDREARRLLGRPRGSSVFSPPARPTLELCGQKDRYGEASEVNRKASGGTAISQQAFWIGPKIREVDEAMTPELENQVYEVHPEVCFAEIAGHPMRNGKSRRAGREERWEALRREFPQLPPEPAFPEELRRRCDVTDYIDAIACVWTAARIAAGEAVSLPHDAPRDGRDLRMAIWR